MKSLSNSYGIISFALNTKKWCMVRKKHTNYFTSLLRGSYRKSLLPSLFKNLTIYEYQMILNMFDNINYFVEVYNKIGFHKDYIDLSKRKFIKDVIPFIEEYKGR